MAKGKKKEEGVEIIDFREHIKNVDPALVTTFEKGYQTVLFDIDNICSKCYCVVKKRVHEDHRQYHYDVNLWLYVMGSATLTLSKALSDEDKD